MGKGLARLVVVVTAALWLGLIGLAACSPSASSSTSEEGAQAAEPVKVACDNGVMLGRSEDGVTSFKGVPFAKPPVGELRWRAPQAPEASTEEIECYDFGYTALQYEWPTEQASYFPKSEDCLTLNIWKNNGVANSKDPKPVMVFFHGGAFCWGGTTDPLYNGQNFAKAHDDVILVTCNYRLGLMAWADFSQIEGGQDYTDLNLGLRDQIAALQWIQTNIAAFGGDPDNVTIFGESAGAWSTSALAISPAAQGLFKRVIAQSGQVAPKDRKAAQEYADYIMEAAGATNMEELLAVSGEEWIELDREHDISDRCPYVVTDGDIIPEDLDQAFKDAAQNGIQLLIGSTNDEWNYFMTDSKGETSEEKFASWVEGMDSIVGGAYEGTDEKGKEALDQLFEYEKGIVPSEYVADAKTRDALAQSGVVSELWRFEIMDFADRFADAGGDTYAYLWKVPSDRDDMFKSAVHAIDLPYVFNNTEEDLYAGSVDEDVAAHVQETWINFAKTGDPSTDRTSWKAYNSDTRDTMVIGKEAWESVSDPCATQRQLLEIAYPHEPFHVW